MMQVVVTSVISLGVLAGLVALMGMLVSERLGRIAAVLRDGTPVSGWDPDQLRLPLRYAA